MKSLKILAAAALVASMTVVSTTPASAGVTSRVELCKLWVKHGIFGYTRVGDCLGRSFNQEIPEVCKELVALGEYDNVGTCVREARAAIND